MPPPQTSSRRPIVNLWIAQMVQTVVLAGVVLVFVDRLGGAMGTSATQWERYALWGIVIAALPAVLYVRWFKRILNADEAAAVVRRGEPDPRLRNTLRRALTLGGALCDLPMAVGVLILMLGGDKRFFLGGTFITLAVRLSYRPFTRSRAR
jgi:hypothetical protein